MLQREISTSPPPPAPYLDFGNAGHQCSATSSREIWRARVRRMAVYFLEERRETNDSFDDRECVDCGKPVALNRAIFLASEPWRCGDSLYAGPEARDGYWYAIALLGVDPDGSDPSTSHKIGWWRRRQLARACASVGLTFGELRAPNA